MSDHARPVLVASWNGAPATAHAAALHAQGTPLLDAIVAGIGLVEDDPSEMSVGFGGLPNEEGDVELDASVMDGPAHKAGAVAGLRRCRRAALAALQVLRRTDHALLVGEGALAFARRCGLPIEDDLNTPASREAWLQWKAQLSTRDAWIARGETRSDFDPARWAGHVENTTPGRPPAAASTAPATSSSTPSSFPPVVPFTFGTIHVSGLDGAGNLFACTSTSGLSYKIPGRVGDSAVVGAGIFVDNRVGSAGATGRGEATLHNAGAYEVVRAMESGMTPDEACLHTLRRLVSRTLEPRLLEGGLPRFNVTLYALRKDGLAGGASIYPGYECVTQRGPTTAMRPCASLLTEAQEAATRTPMS